MKVEDYLKSFSQDIWYKKANFAHSKIQRLKTEKAKVDYINDLYSTYLQLIENFIIFLLVRWTQNTIFLFKDSREIIHHFKKLEKQIISWILSEVLRTVPKDRYSRIYKKHESLIKEIFKDYFQDRGFLNSYKHWYRITENSYNNSIWIKVEGSEWPFVNIMSVAHSISYLSVEKDKKTGDSLIFEQKVGFDTDYIFWKIMFITHIISVIKQLYFAEIWKEIKVEYCTLDNTWLLEKKNSMRFKFHKYTIKK